MEQWKNQAEKRMYLIKNLDGQSLNKEDSYQQSQYTMSMWGGSC